ncbi:Ankyrin-2 [Durusdinium trenchii]|uniref:Ankyrin-2 n=1 Tax=Durusdinium trenchii TaxID=1381693 RepID=A0ABP0MU31_9DINO
MDQGDDVASPVQGVLAAQASRSPLRGSLDALQDLLMGELPLEVLTQQLRSWRGCEHVVEGSLSKDALRHLLNMTLQAIRQSAWEEALVCSNVMEECSNLDQGLVSWVEEDQFIHKFQAALQLVVASFGEMLEESMLPGGQLEEMESKQTLSALVTSLCGLLLSANRRADQPRRPGRVGLAAEPALRAESDPRRFALCRRDVSGAKAVPRGLQARRALADVLNTLLEDASQELRAEQEHLILTIEPGASRLVETLCAARPDPKLHEMLVEMLWRGLRRQDDGSPNQAPALELLAALRGPRVARQLKEEVSAEHVKDWGIDLALQISRRPEVHYLDCSISWGGLRANECAATFSSHSLHVVGGLLNTEEVSEVQVEFEIPWVFVQNPDAVVARGFPLRLTVLLEPLKACGTLAPGVAELVWLSEGILQIESSVDEGKTKEIFEDLNKLFQGEQRRHPGDAAETDSLRWGAEGEPNPGRADQPDDESERTPEETTRSLWDSDADYDSQSEQDSDVDDKLVSIWQRLERNGLLGPGTRRWFQHFCFALPGRLCAFATISACIYCLVRPNEQIVALLGKKAFNLAGAMCAIATLCGISSAYGATHILHDTSFRKLVTRVKSSQAPAFTADDDQFNEKDSDWRGRRFDFDWLPMLNLIARLLGYALLIGIPLCPAFESDPMYLLAWLLAVVFLVFFCPGCFYIQTLVVKLSHHHVKGLIEDIEHAAKRKAPGKPAQFWQEMTEKHKKMDRTLETIWDLAMWMVLPHFISSVAFGTIGLVACLTGLATRSDSLALAGLPILLIMLFEVTNRLDEMASITKMCMSTATKTPMTSILASAIAASGKSPWKNDAGCKSVGYNDLADERADHARFLQYLRTNRAGVEVRGVLIDSNLIGRVYLHCGTGFLALFSYLLANLNIHQEDLLTGSQEAIRHVSNILFNQ